MDYFLASNNQRFTRLHHRLQQQHPQLRLARQQTELVRLKQRLDTAVDARLRRASLQQQRLSQRLSQHTPLPRIHRLQTRLQQHEYRLSQLVSARLGASRERFATLAAHLEAVSPLATLARGYSVTQAQDGKLLKQTRQIKPGDTLTTRLADGIVESQVTVIAPVKKTRKPKSA